MFNKEIKCPNCGYEGKGKRVGGGLFKGVIFFILALVFVWTLIVPLFFFIWVLKNMNKHACPKCGNRQVVAK